MARLVRYSPLMVQEMHHGPRALVGQQAQREQMGRMELTEQLAHKAQRESMDRTVLMEQQGRRDRQEKQELMVRMELLAPQAQREPMDITGLMDWTDRMVFQALLVLPEQQALKDLQAQVVVREEPRAHKVQQDLLEKTARME